MAAADTGVGDTPQVATEKIGESTCKPCSLNFQILFVLCFDANCICTISRGQGGYGDRSGSYRDGYDSYGKHE